MIAHSSHHEMEVAIRLQTIAFGDHRLQGSGGLFESGARLRGVAAKLPKAKAKPEKYVSIGMQVVALLGRKGRSVWR